MGAESIIKVIIKGEEFDLHRATEKAHHDLEHAGKSHGKFAGVAKAAMATAGMAAVAYVASSVKVASEFQEAHDRMDQAFRVSKVEGGKWVDDAEKQGAKFGYTRDKIDNALASSVRALGNAKQAHKALNVAEDLAAATGMDLQSATMMVTKATEGNTKSLKKLGIEWHGATGGAKAVAKAQDGVTKASGVLEKAQAALGVVHMKIKGGLLKGAAANFALMAAQDKVTKATGGVADAHKKLKAAQEAGGKIVDLLAAKYKGSAADASHTFAGKVKALHAAFTNFQATVGNKVIPILLKVGDWLGKHKPVLIAFAGAVGVLVAAFVAYKVAMAAVAVWNAAWQVALGAIKVAQGAATAAQWLFNAAMSANPIALVVIAIAALAAGVIYAYTHFKWFHKFIDKAWQILQTGFHWIQKNWPLLLAILTGPFGLAALLIIKNFNKIKAAVLAVINWVKKNWPLLLAILTGPIGIAVLAIVRNWDKIKNVFNSVKDGIGRGVDAIVSFFTGMPKRITGAAKSIGSTILHGILDGIGSAVGAVTGFVENIARSMKQLINQYIIDPIRGIHIHWGGFHGIGKFDIHPFDFIPRLHSGGIYNTSRGEGLAVLQNGEGVFTPGQMAAMGVRNNSNSSQHITNNFPAGTNPTDVAVAQRRYKYRNGSR